MDSVRVAGAAVLTVVTTIALTMLFSVAVDLAAGLFIAHTVLAVAFPLAGVLTWALYRCLRVPFGWGTKHVVGNAERGGIVSARIVPAIFIGTCSTIIVGGSVGKEAAALQMGGGLAASWRRFLNVGEEHERLICACALSCALSVLLGTPIASALFSVELLQYRSRKVIDYVAIFLASCAAKAVSWGLSFDTLAVGGSVPMFSPELLGAVLALIVACAAMAICFCLSLQALRTLSGQKRLQVPVILLVGFGAVVFVLGFGGGAFSGTGMAQITPALSGQVDGPFFVGKFLFTLLLLGAGFKGGEIMPTLCVGATFGCYLGVVFGVDPAFMAIISLVVYFTGCTNCPLAAVALACESFSPSGIGWYLLAAALAYAITFRVGFYANSTFYSSLLKDAVSSVFSKGRRG